jgi:hypothetical protein
VLIAFLGVELHARDPMMDIRVFRDHVYDAAIFVVFAALFCIYGALFVSTQYFQNVRVQASRCRRSHRNVRAWRRGS